MLAYYYTPGIDQAIHRGSVMAAATDAPVIQGRVALDQAVRALEGKLEYTNVGPIISVVTKDNVKTTDMTQTLALDGFKPTFAVE